MAVSYTHLDVYKRQGLCGLAFLLENCAGARVDVVLVLACGGVEFNLVLPAPVVVVQLNLAEGNAGLTQAGVRKRFRTGVRFTDQPVRAGARGGGQRACFLREHTAGQSVDVILVFCASADKLNFIKAAPVVAVERRDVYKRQVPGQPVGADLG